MLIASGWSYVVLGIGVMVGVVIGPLVARLVNDGWVD